MTHPMPDPTDTPATKRMTTAEVAALAQQVDGRLDDLAAVVTDISTRLQDIGGATGPTTAGPSHDQVDARIHEALQPLHDEVHEIRQRTPLTNATGNLDAILARLEEAERKAIALDAGAITERVAQEIHPGIADLRRRLAAVEETAKALDGDPVSQTLAEDALADQIEHAVDRKLSAMFEAADLTPAMLANLRREFGDLRQHVETHGTTVTRALVNEVAEAVRKQLPTTAVHELTTAGGTGAAKKVLQLMRQVTHIGKENEANLGQGGRFKFRSVDDAMDAVGYAMRDVGMILGTEILKDETTHTPITKSGTNKDGTTWQNTVVWTSTKLTVRYTFTDPEDGSIHPMEMTGEGRDASDKSTSKAASMALKYGLFQALMIPVTGLDDSDAAPPQRMEQDQQRPPASQPSSNTDQRASDQAKAQRAGEALQAIRNVYRVPGGVQAQAAKLTAIMRQVQGEGLLEFVVEGSTLDQHGKAAMATLQAPPPADEPPADEGGY